MERFDLDPALTADAERIRQLVDAMDRRLGLGYDRSSPQESGQPAAVPQVDGVRLTPRIIDAELPPLQ